MGDPSGQFEAATVRQQMQQNVRPLPSSSHDPEVRWRITYATQCCTFMVEKLNRDFNSPDRRDISFRVDLRGLGRLIKTSF